jgi:thiamine biosynthesis lipoprotein
MQKFSWESMGTHWEVGIYFHAEVQPRYEKLFQEIFELSNGFDKKYSRFVDTSLVMQMSRQSGVYDVGEDLAKILEIYFKLEKITDGKVTPCIGNTISDLGYDKEYSFQKKSLVRPVSRMSHVLKILNEKEIEILFPTILDIGAIGKGYFIDKLKNFLISKNTKSFYINGSGDIYCQNLPENLRVGLENPNNFEEVLGVVEINKGSLCASGTTRRKWESDGKVLNHYVNPSTLGSVDDVVATFSIAENATIADAITSCLFFISPEVLLEKMKAESLVTSFEYMVIQKHGLFRASDFFKSKLFMKN